jgi:hypothetical protein
MSDTTAAAVEARLEEALARHGARDAREYYRGQLRELKGENPRAYEEAVAHYRDVLLPALERGGEDPVALWTAYGQHLAQLRAPGRSVVVDGTGASHGFEVDRALGALVLHIPEQAREAAMIVALPAELTPAQRATVDFLVARKKKLRT